MVKKRLLFTLIYNDGYFMLSRNFRLQRVGDVKWLNKFYNFKNIAHCIDELIILNVTRGKKNYPKFTEIVKQVIANVFIPVATGGGVNSLEDAEFLMHSGADKLVLNSCLHKNPKLVKELVKKYGSQCIIGSIDFRSNQNSLDVYIENGETKLNTPLLDYIKYLQSLNLGEIYLNSIDKDGTGHGYQLELLENIIQDITIPLIMAGGAGNQLHLEEGLRSENINAVATANLYNFVGDGLLKAREYLLNTSNINLARWKM